MHAERDIHMTYLSVCPSHSGTVLKRMYIPSNFSLTSRMGITIFARYRRYKIPKGNSLSGGIKYTRVGKKLRFSTEIAVYLGNGNGTSYRPMVTVDH